MAARVNARIVVREKSGKLYWGCSLCGEYLKEIHPFSDSTMPNMSKCCSCGKKFTK